VGPFTLAPVWMRAEKSHAKQDGFEGAWMTNVLIAYTNNVCSTPMIEYARLHKSIFVPVREHFDEHLFIEYINDREQFCPQLANILSFLYSRKNCAFFDRNELIDYRYGQQLPSLLDKPHILFKWRCYPRKLPESHKIVDILAENNVIPAIMLRSSLSEQAIKVFLSETVYGGRLQQFKTGNMSDDEYENYQIEQSQFNVVLSCEELEKIIDIADNFLRITIRLIELVHFYFPKTDIPFLIFAEEIFKPLIDYDRYNFVLSCLFGKIDPLDQTLKPPFRKGGLDLNHCANPELVFEDERMREMESKYLAATGGLRNIFAGVHYTKGSNY